MDCLQQMLLNMELAKRLKAALYLTIQSLGWFAQHDCKSGDDTARDLCRLKNSPDMQNMSFQEQK